MVAIDAACAVCRVIDARRVNEPFSGCTYTLQVNSRVHQMKPVPVVSKLTWVHLDNPTSVIEHPFEGTLEQATTVLEEKAHAKALFGQVLAADGRILKNIAST